MNSKVIVVSAVNIVVGGTLTVLQDCLRVLSQQAQQNNLRIIALVHNKDLAFFDNIEYIEIPWAKRCWLNRLWTEYVMMKKISIKLFPVYLWFSLHDTTPNVVAQHQAVYCHNSFSFYKYRFRDIFINYKIVLFAVFTKYIYRKNIHKNKYVIVQQPWFKDEFKRMFQLQEDKFIVAYPIAKETTIPIIKKEDAVYRFFFPSSPGVHKNFDALCEATRILTDDGVTEFEVLITLDGTKDKYDKYIFNKYSKIRNIRFIGFQSRESMTELYGRIDCLVFPSKMESWGLPISEFAITGKPMLLSNLPYAKTAAAGSKATAFFDPEKAADLAQHMKRLIKGDMSKLSPIAPLVVNGVHTSSWKELIEIVTK